MAEGPIFGILTHVNVYARMYIHIRPHFHDYVCIHTNITHTYIHKISIYILYIRIHICRQVLVTVIFALAGNRTRDVMCAYICVCVYICMCTYRSGMGDNILGACGESNS